MEARSACSNYIIDITAAEFGACKNCGLKKLAHNSQTTANAINGTTANAINEGSVQDVIRRFSQQTSFVPIPSQNNNPERILFH